MLASDQVIHFPLAVSLNEWTRPNAATFFRDAHWGMCLELAAHLCQYGSQTLVVVGESGYGKTSMRYALENRQLANLHIIDDAHNLSLDQVARLLHEKEQRVVLLTRPELLQRIKNSTLRAEFKALARIIELEPLTIKEMENFLAHQWHALGHIGTIPYTKAELQKLYAISGGIPGKVKQLFTDSLRGHNVLNAKDDEKAEGKGITPFMVGLIVAGGIALCLLALMWPTTNKSKITQTAVVELPDQQSLSTQVPVDEETFAGLDAAQEELEKQKLAALEEKLVNMQQQMDLEEQPVAEEPLLAQTELSKVAAPAKIPTKVSNTATGNKQEKSLLSVNKKHYALQLVAAGNEQKIKDFISKNNLTGKAKYYTGTRNGKPWYTVIYGDFTDKTAALAEMGKLPAEIKNFGPWVRQSKHSCVDAKK